MTSASRPASAQGPAGSLFGARAAARGPDGSLTCLRPRRGGAPGLWHLLTERPPGQATERLARGPVAPGDRMLVVQVDDLACPAAVPLARWIEVPSGE